MEFSCGSAASAGRRRSHPSSVPACNHFSLTLQSLSHIGLAAAARQSGRMIAHATSQPSVDQRRKEWKINECFTRLVDVDTGLIKEQDGIEWWQKGESECDSHRGAKEGS